MAVVLVNILAFIATKIFFFSSFTWLKIVKKIENLLFFKAVLHLD